MEVRDDGYELFRRAVVERDAEAWAAIALRYRPMLISWVGRCPAAAAAGESFEDMADEGLARAWRALTPGRFADFPNLAALLGYLHVCVTATVIDAARARLAYERIGQQSVEDTHKPLEQAVLDQIGRAELWELVIGLAACEAERVALIERYVFDLPPRVIQSRHPDLFPSVMNIYAATRNVCDRLRRHKEVQRYYADRRAA